MVVWNSRKEEGPFCDAKRRRHRRLVRTYMTGKTIIAFSGVTFSFSGAPPLFETLTLNLYSGTFYLVQGPSGSGKSTLLRLICRLEEPSSGEILFKDRPLPSYPPPKLRRSILYIQQIPTVMDASVRRNLLLPFSFRNNRDLPRPDDESLKRDLKSFMLEDLSLDSNAMKLSVGQMQRLCFIRGLLLSPEVLLLDEPSSALDEISGRVVETTAERLCRESGLTVVMVSHKRFEPKEIRPVVLKVAEGRVVVQ